jgi:hypothetical protein
LAEAKAAHAPEAGFEPKAVAQLYISVVQGSLMIAKSAGNNDVFCDNIEQFRDHLKCLFGLNAGKSSGKSSN